MDCDDRTVPVPVPIDMVFVIASYYSISKEQATLFVTECHKTGVAFPVVVMPREATSDWLSPFTYRRETDSEQVP